MRPCPQPFVQDFYYEGCLEQDSVTTLDMTHGSTGWGKNTHNGSADRNDTSLCLFLFLTVVGRSLELIKPLGHYMIFNASAMRFNALQEVRIATGMIVWKYYAILRRPALPVSPDPYRSPNY